jgi:hypothetical protein
LKLILLYNIDNNITDGKYNISDDNPEKYKNQITNNAKETFVDCNSILESIIGSNFEFYNSTKYILKEKPFIIEIIYAHRTKKKNVTTSFYASMVQVFSSFCNLLVKFENNNVDDPNLYNFIHNSFNNLGIGLNTQIQLFVNELKIRQFSYVKNILIYSIIYLILHIIIYFMISRSYYSIVKKKASYIEVFYGIGLSLIKSSIKKCEIFINKINQEDENVKTKGIDDETTSFNSSSNLENISLEKNFEKKRNANNKKKSKKLKKNKKIVADKKSRIFRIITQIALLFSFFYLVEIFLTFLFLVNSFIFCGNFILNMQKYHNNIIELFNGYREFLFDENSIINNLLAYDYLLKQEESYYSSNTETVNYTSLLNGVVAEINKNNKVLHENGLCSYYISYFNSQEECENFLGGKGGIISLGFHILMNYFVEEIRNARNYMKVLLDHNILIGNLSDETNIDYNDTTYDLELNETLKFRMVVFNLEQTHSRLNIIFYNVVLQYINKSRNSTINTIKNSVANGHVKYIIMIILYMIVFLIIFIYYWIPMIRRMNIEIYKTKNMLSIIPLQILASQPNIRILLNISKNND